jgi:GntR family transcriptional regulator/MocR family aminotransferase
MPTFRSACPTPAAFLSRSRSAYAQPQGQPALREAIAQHVSVTRAVACDGDDVLVTSGAQQAFDLLARVLVSPGKTMIALEDPGYPPLRNAFEAAGARIAAVPTDAEGLVVERISAGARVVCVTPSHQFPLGTAMSLQRRTALLEFARRHAAVIVEDDYDGEFRYGGRPLDALQTLDRSDSVFYVGTFSKSLFPALRLGYVVAPAWAHAALLAAKQVADWHCNMLAQDTLAAFITEGHLARHVRKMRRIYGARRAALLQALAQHARGRLEAAPSESGLHIAAALLGPQRAPALVQRAAGEGIRIQSIEPFRVELPAPNGLVLGFGMIDEREIEPALRRLARLLR